ncbi:MAG TPA: amidohydrolase family protein [Azospira sp.]|nr:amidohydrolase family protein [Azospira sp.]
MTMTLGKICWAALATLATAMVSSSALAEEPPLIDVHMHFEMAPSRDPVGSARSAIQHMAQYGIKRSLLMPPPYPESAQRNFYDIEDMLFVSQDYPGKFALLGGSRLNVMLHAYAPEQVDDAVRAQFRKLAEQTIAYGAVGIGEIAIHHVSIPAMGSQHAYERVSPLHPLLQTLAEVAAEKDIPIDIHFDIVPEEIALPDSLKANPKNPPVLPENLQEFKQFLAKNPKTKIIWSHVGFEPLLTRHPGRVEAFLKEFPNLYMSFRLNRNAPSPAATMAPNGQVKARWTALIEAFSERFMLGSDAFYDRHGIARGSGTECFENFRTLISTLSEPAKSNVAFRNAEKLFRLND